MTRSISRTLRLLAAVSLWLTRLLHGKLRFQTVHPLRIEHKFGGRLCLLIK